MNLSEVRKKVNFELNVNSEKEYHDYFHIMLLYLKYSMPQTHDPASDSEDPNTITDKKRKLGLIVVRGTQVSLVSPEEGMEEIANPFVGAQEE